MNRYTTHGSRFGATLLAGLIAGLGAAAPVFADEDAQELLRNPSIANYKGYAEFKMAHYAEARAIWEVLAGAENGEALFNLAILAEDGLGEPRDMQRALGLYQRGALAGSGKAQYRLGLLYSTGDGVAQDLAAARRFLSMAAADGDADAQRILLGLDGAAATTEFDRAERLGAGGRHEAAAEIYRRLAADGDARAQTRLAWMYEAGRGVARDLGEAARRFGIAAEAGDAEAQYALAVMLETGRGLAPDRERSRHWLERSAAHAYPPAVVARDERRKKTARNGSASAGGQERGERRSEEQDRAQ